MQAEGFVGYDDATRSYSVSLHINATPPRLLSFPDHESTSAFEKTKAVSPPCPTVAGVVTLGDHRHPLAFCDVAQCYLDARVIHGSQDEWREVRPSCSSCRNCGLAHGDCFQKAGPGLSRQTGVQRGSRGSSADHWRASSHI